MLAHHRVILIAPHQADAMAFIQSLSEIPVEIPPSNANPAVVSMNFGRLSLPDLARLYFFGLPWGDDYETIWHVVGRDLLGVIVLANVQKAAEIMPALARFAPGQVVAVDPSALSKPHGALIHLVEALDNPSEQHRAILKALRRLG